MMFWIGFALVNAVLLGALLAVWFIRRPQTRQHERPHAHDWRAIGSPFARQCRDKRCGLVEYSNEIPEGMKEWIAIMTAKPEERFGPGVTRCLLCGYQPPCAHFCEQWHLRPPRRVGEALRPCGMCMEISTERRIAPDMRRHYDWPPHVFTVGNVLSEVDCLVCGRDTDDFHERADGKVTELLNGGPQS